MKFMVFWIGFILLIAKGDFLSLNLTCNVKMDDKRNFTSCVARDIELFNETDEIRLVIDPKDIISTEIVSLSLYTKDNHSGFTSIPTKMFTILPNIRALSIKSHLNRLSSSDWFNADYIEWLQLLSINVSELEAKTFNVLNRLEDLTVNWSTLEIIRGFALVGLNNLTYLDLQHNKIHTIEDDAFDLPNLETLNIRSNKLTTLSDYLFCKLPSLNRLDLSSNYLTQIGRSLHCAPNLISVVLKYNKIKDIDLSEMAKLPRLKLLDLGASGFSFSSKNDTILWSNHSVENSSLERLILFRSNLVHLYHLEQLGVFNGLRHLSLEETPFLYLNSSAADIKEVLPNLSTLTIFTSSNTIEENVEKLGQQLENQNIELRKEY